MTARDFAYWLQGYFEITNLIHGTATLNPSQVECIKKHLEMVFIVEGDKPLIIGKSNPNPNVSDDFKPRC